MLFTDRIEALKQLTPGQRQNPELIPASRSGIDRGTALYDALASELCRMRTAENLRQAVVVLTDGADQHSRLKLQQLIELAQMSTPQIFMIGFFSPTESQAFQGQHKTVMLFGEREIDNPMFVFDRLAKESGAESFFPASEKDLRAALDRISKMLQAQYTLAYYPENADRFRNIEVRVRRRNVRAITRRGVGGSSTDGPVVFKASACEVSARDHPYPWELKSTLTPNGSVVYREDFSDPNSGWPNRSEQFPADLSPRVRRQLLARGGYKRGLRYVLSGYEISHYPPEGISTAGSILDGIVAAHGPAWHNVRASVAVRTDWSRAFRSEQRKSKNDLLSYFEVAPGLVFHLNNDGYYALLLAGGQLEYATSESLRIKQFKLVKRLFDNDDQGQHIELIPWTSIHSFISTAGEKPAEAIADTHKIAVEYRDGRITVIVDDRRVGSIHDDRLPSGLVGLALFGRGDAVFDDLLVQTLR